LSGDGAAAAVAEVDLAERFGREGPQLLFAGALVLGVEEAGGVLRGRARMRRQRLKPSGQAAPRPFLSDHLIVG
jgi:hypothetical protein